MTVTFLLICILFFLMTIVGGKRGVKSFFILLLNFITLFFGIILIAFNCNPIIVIIIESIIISSTTLFLTNGYNKKSLSALLSVLLVVILTIIIIYRIGLSAKIQGFGKEEAEEILSYSLYINLDFSKLVICVILTGLLGAIIDVAISISSSLNEIYINNTQIKRNDLYKSGINIGKDILGAMTNTLFFAYIGSFLALMIWFRVLHYSFFDIINAKIFVAEILQILCSGIGIILIIPITSFITSNILFSKKIIGKEELN